ncbi:MAG: hypothetical protein IT584_01580 [Chlamydiae bacterium]|nr:hypothetical protein [Chlamydiota bacterium]
MWHLATCEGGLIIRNVVSKRYLIHSFETSKVMGNPLTHIRNQSKQENKKSILENTQVYEGVWKFIKLGDFIRKVESEIPRQFSPNRAAPFTHHSLD